jgi:mRNA-degrading endonuclease RelE of RelBE toxin-antitoxin system
VIPLKVEWSPRATDTASGFLEDRDGLAAVLAATDRLAEDPRPPEAFVRGEFCRLHVGRYRVMYRVEGDLVTIQRVDRV